jgi:hypothetical protein
MGLFVPKPRFLPGEHLVARRAANHSRGNRAIGGRLFVTQRRLIFAPNVIDRLIGARPWACRLEDIAAVRDAERTKDQPFSGGMRRRLLVNLRGDGQEFFVVNHVDDLIQMLRQAVSDAHR